MNLAEWAAANPGGSGPKCWACKLDPDVRAEIAAGHRAGIGSRKIAEWLRAEGHDAASEHKVANHVRNHLD